LKYSEFLLSKRFAEKASASQVLSYGKLEIINIIGLPYGLSVWTRVKA